MPEENNNMPRRRISFGFLFSILLVAGLIAIFAYRIFGNRNTASAIKADDYVGMLVNEKVKTSVIEHHFEGSYVTITGTYNNGDQYIVRVDNDQYASTEFNYTVTAKKDLDYKHKTLSCSDCREEERKLAICEGENENNYSRNH